MGIQDRLSKQENKGVARKNRVQLLLEALTEIERIELEEALFDKRWSNAAITRSIPQEYDKYPEAHQLKQESVREWRIKRGIN